MKKADVQIGATYLVKVAGNLVPVKITNEHPNGGWEGRSLKTRKTIRIKSAQRLRKLLADASWSTSTPEENRRRHADQSKAIRESGDGNACLTEPAAQDANVAAGRDTGGSPKLSLLNAAAIVLKASGEPMTCSQIVQKAAETTAWKPGKGLTPANTLSAAMRREIKVKGNASRFRLADRGTFALASKS